MTSSVHDCAGLFERLRDYERLGTDADACDTASAPRALSAAVRICSDAYSVPLSRVVDLVRNPRLMRVPGAPAWIPGALRVGQQMVAVVRGDWVVQETDRAGAGNPSMAIVLDLEDKQVAVLIEAIDSLRHTAQSGAGATELDLQALSRRMDASALAPPQAER